MTVPLRPRPRVGGVETGSEGVDMVAAVDGRPFLEFAAVLLGVEKEWDFVVDGGAEEAVAGRCDDEATELCVGDCFCSLSFAGVDGEAKED